MLELYAPGAEAQWLASFRFGVEVRPRWCECDPLGHVSNVAYPEYLEFSRLQYLIAAGDPEPGPFAFSHVTAELHLRYIAACFYDEPLRVASRLVALGRSSATMEQAIVGRQPAAIAGGEGSQIRAISRVVFVRVDGDTTIPWSAEQRAALELFEGHTFSSSSS